MSYLYQAYLALDQAIKRAEKIGGHRDSQFLFIFPPNYWNKQTRVSLDIDWPYDATNDDKLGWADRFQKEYPEADIKQEPNSVGRVKLSLHYETASVLVTIDVGDLAATTSVTINQ